MQFSGHTYIYITAPLSNFIIEMEVKFIRKLNKSYEVEYAGKYFNQRCGPHVETAEPEAKLIGKKFKLYNRQVKKVGNDVAVMYLVEGVMNGTHVAHFTAYFGPESKASQY